MGGLLFFGLLTAWWLGQPEKCENTHSLFLSAAPHRPYQQTWDFNATVSVRSRSVRSLFRNTEPDSFRYHWQLDSILRITDEPFLTYTFPDTGEMKVGLRLEPLRGNCPLDTSWVLNIRPDTRLEVDFDYTTSGDSFTFKNATYIWQPFQNPEGNSTKISYDWDFGNGIHSNEENPVHIYSEAKEYEVSLTVDVSWPDSSLAYSSSQEVNSLPQIELPFLSLQDEDLSGDFRSSEAIDKLAWILLALTLLYFLIEGIIGWRRKVMLDERKRRKPPIRPVLNLDHLGLEYFHSPAFSLLTRRLRARRADENLPVPDMPDSIRQTVEAGGFPTLAWRLQSQASQYLILIEWQGPQDHLAQLYLSMARELGNRDISVAAYFYQREPQLLLRTDGSGETLPLDRLINQYPGYRLLIVGEGIEWLDPEGQKPANWTKRFRHWPERALLSTRATEQWGHLEKALSKEFLILPATEAGWMAVVDQWQAEEASSPADWKKHQLRLAPPSELTKVGALGLYLGEPGLRWLAACAWYPQLYWPLSIQLGHQIEGFQEKETPLRKDLDFLLRLFRLPFFRKGSISIELRERLVRLLPKKQAVAVRQHLIDLLRQPRNQQGEDSWAEADQQARLAHFEYLNSRQDAAARAALKERIKHLNPRELKDSFTFRELGRIKPGLLSLVLPASYFRHKLPLFGIRQRWRVFFLGGMFTFLTAWAFYCGSTNPEGYDRRQVYGMEAFDLDGPKDTARWYVHEGWRKFQEDSLAEVRPDFERALGYDSTLTSAQQNFLINIYDQARQQAKVDNWAAVEDSMDSALEWMNARDPERKLKRPQVWLNYAAGISRLYQRFYNRPAFGVGSEPIYDPERGENVALAKDKHPMHDLMRALCDSIGERVYQQHIRDSLADRGDWLGLLQARTLSEYRKSLDACLNLQLSLRINSSSLQVRSSPGGGEILMTARKDDVYALKEVSFPGVSGRNLVPRREARLFTALESLILPPEARLEWLQGEVSPAGYLAVEYEGKKAYVNPYALISTSGETWYRIQLPEGASGWVDATGVRLIGDRDRTPPERPPLVYTGRVLGPAGQPFPAQVQVRRAGRRLAGIAAGASGNFRIELRNLILPTAGDSLRFTAEYDELRGRTDIALREPTQPLTIRLEDRPAPLQIGGEVRDIAGQLLAEVRVRALGEEEFTNADGSFMLRSDQQPDSVRFALEKQDYRSLDTTLARTYLDSLKSVLVFVLPPRPPELPILPKMIRITGGQFSMGADSLYDWTLPVHPVNVPDFYLAETEVTNEQFAVFLNAKGNQEEGGTPWYDDSGEGYEGFAAAAIRRNHEGRWVVLPGKENLPVNYVSWYGAVAYCEWVSALTGERWRLPSEAEWEYAAGNGTKHTRYSWGDREPQGKQGGNMADSSFARQFGIETRTDYVDGFPGLAPVGSFNPNDFGLFDMSGNLWEWCQDPWHDNYEGAPANGSAWEDGSDGTFRVSRGGSWSNDASFLRVANRYNNLPDGRFDNLGFRPARTP